MTKSHFLQPSYCQRQWLSCSPRFVFYVMFHMKWALSQPIRPILKYGKGVVHGANIGPIWGRRDPGGPYVGPMNFAILDSKAKALWSKMFFLVIGYPNIQSTIPNNQLTSHGADYTRFTYIDHPWRPCGKSFSLIKHMTPQWICLNDWHATDDYCGAESNGMGANGRKE